MWEEYQELLEKGDTVKKALDSLDLERYCCRGLFLGHVDLIDIVAEFKRS